MTIEQTVELPASPPTDGMRNIERVDEQMPHGVGPLNAVVTVSATGRRLVLDVPREIPAGPIILTFTPVEVPVDKPVRTLRSLRGIDKGRDTMDAYFKRHWAENDRERAEEREQYPEHFQDKQP